jgi:hypothetical protein
LSFVTRQLTPHSRALLLMLFALGRAVTSAQGQSAMPAGPSAELTPEQIALLAEMLPKWSVTADVDAAVGYKDNVALSHANAEASGFARGGFNLLVMHPAKFPDGRTDYSASVLAEGTHYFSSETVDHESLANARVDWNYRRGDVFKFNAMAGGLYLDQVLDVSDTDVQRVVVQSKKMVTTFGPTLRWAPKTWWWMEAHGTARREDYRDEFNNATIGEGSLAIGWKPSNRFEARIMGEHARRRYESREQYSAGGRPLAGTLLRIVECNAEARFDVTWDAAAHWKTTTRVSLLDYGDNGSSYFNYRQRRARHRIEWKSGAWRARLEGSARRLDFEVLTVGVGISPPLRVKEEFTAELRIERKLNEQWTISTEYRWERSRCNDPIASYRMNEGLLGATWSWDK